VKCIDATGAGDAFASGLAVAIAEGKTIPEAAEFANAVAALSTTALGAQAGMPGRAAVDAFRKD
jgi:sugar/nucleoside kinase (ribokinase family)